MKRKLPPDNRLDWRDPDMPVMMMGNRRGDPEHWPRRMLVIKPEEMTAQCQWQMRYVEAPDYKLDDSYWWNKRNRK